MKLFVKKVAPEWEGVFKKGDALPEVDDVLGTHLVEQGLATATKPKSNAKNKPKQETAK
jgi:hypothetical protein